MTISIDNAFPILVCLSLSVMLLPPKWAVVKTVVGVLDAAYAVLLLISAFTGSASA